MSKPVHLGHGLLVLAIIGLIFISGCIQTQTQQQPTTSGTTEKTPAIVSRIIDGDTIQLETGERVRLLGINTPEKGQPYYKEATNRLKELIAGKQIILEKDVDDKGQYGRLLRYVYVNNENIDVKMVAEGYATVYIIKPDIKYETELKEAWKECLNNKVNLCKPPESENDRNIKISYFHWNAAGNDAANLNDEYVNFTNTGPNSLNLTGWTVKDASSREPYVFPVFILKRGATVTLHTGYGTNTNTQLFWCVSGNSCKAIWNNKGGDTLFLRNSNGELVLSYSYTGY